MKKDEVLQYFKEDTETIQNVIDTDFIVIFVLSLLCVISWMIWCHVKPVIMFDWISLCKLCGWCLWLSFNCVSSLLLYFVIVIDIFYPQVIFKRYRNDLNNSLWSDNNSLGLHVRLYDNKWIVFDKYKLYTKENIILKGNSYKQHIDYVLKIGIHLEFKLTKRQYKCMKEAKKDDTKPIIMFNKSELEYIGKDYEYEEAIQRDILGFRLEG